MKQISSADFRKNYAKEAEPVEVTAWGKVIGRWLPTGVDIDAPVIADEQPPEVVAEFVDEPRMTIRPAKGPAKVLTPREQQIQDPLVLRRLEHERSEQLGSRTYGRKIASERG